MNSGLRGSESHPLHYWRFSGKDVPFQLEQGNQKTGRPPTTPHPGNSTWVKWCLLPMRQIYALLFPFHDSRSNTFPSNNVWKIQKCGEKEMNDT